MTLSIYQLDEISHQKNTKYVYVTGKDDNLEIVFIS